MLPEAKSVAVLFTGGVESSLVGRLAVEKYGADNVVFVLYAMDEYNVFYRKPEKVVGIINDFRSSVERVGGHRELIITNDEYGSVDGWLADRTWKLIQKYNPDVDYMLGGYNNIHKECYELFKEIDFPNSKRPSAEARLIVASEPQRYPELWDLIYKCDGVIYFVEDDYTHKNWQDIDSMYFHSNHVAPLIHMKKEDVIHVYADKGWIEDLYQTKSCNDPTTDIQCGKCKNCLSRRLAFKKAGIEDMTEYEL